MYRLGWFSTGRGEGSRGLLKTVQDTIVSGDLEAQIEFVFCSREYGETEATDWNWKPMAVLASNRTVRICQRLCRISSQPTYPSNPDETEFNLGSSRSLLWFRS